MMKRVLVLLAVFILVASVVCAADFGALMSEGKSALNAKKYDNAEKAFRAALALNPDSAEAELYLGITMSRRGGTKEQLKEAESHLKRALMKTPEDPLTNFELGALFYKRAVPEEAQDFFDNVIELAPGSELARQAEQQLKAIQEGSAEGVREEGKKHWFAALSTGLQYDTNVVLKGELGDLPEDVPYADDWRSIYTVAGGYNFLDTELFKGSAGYSFYQSIHNELIHYNVQAHNGRLGFTYDPVRFLRLGLTGSYDYITLGGAEYEKSGAATASMIGAEGNGFFTMLEGKYSSDEYTDSSRQPDNDEKTGNTYSWTAAQIFPITGDASFRLGYAWEKADARVDSNSYDSDKCFALLNVSLPWKMSLLVSGDYQVRNYSYARNLISGDYRKDEESGYAISLRKEFLDWLSAEAGVSYTNNDSNILEYEYKRTITSVLLKARF